MSEKLVFNFSNICYDVEETKSQLLPAVPGNKTGSVKRILDDVSGTLVAGDMLAVMGPSGCGKTTLLDLLAGRLSSGTQSGTVCISGTPMKRSTFKRCCAYVQQEESLTGTLSVRETLEHSANLNIPDRSQRAGRVSEIIENLGLTVCENVKIGTVFQKGISGGQKRRVSIGTELIYNPLVLFLDEPTSGLDSASAYEVVKHAQSIAAENRIIISTIHQPSADVFFMFNKLLLLTKGRVAYFGNTADVIEHFASIGHACPQYNNPADFLLGLVNVDFSGDKAQVEDIVNAYRKVRPSAPPEACTATVLPLPVRQCPPEWWRTLVLLKRDFLEIMRNPGILWIRMLMYVMLSLMLGTLYVGALGSDDQGIHDRLSLLFFVVAFMVFMSIAVVPFYIQDRSIFLRESMNGYYSVLSYVLSRSVSAIPGIAMIAFSCAIIIYPMAGLYGGVPGYFNFAANLFLALYCAEGFMLMWSGVVPIYIVAMALAAGCYGMFMVTEGFFIHPDSIPPWWIWSYYLAFHTYSFNWFAQNEFEGQDFADAVQFQRGEQVLEYYKLDRFDPWLCAVVLVAWCLGFRAIYYLLLRFVQTGKR